MYPLTLLLSFHSTLMVSMFGNNKGMHTLLSVGVVLWSLGGQGTAMFPWFFVTIINIKNVI